MTISYIALGSNLHDREKSISDASGLLAHDKKISLLRRSPIYETQPVGLPEGAPFFLNAAVEIETDYSPLELLQCVNSIEIKLGRPSQEKGQQKPRVIDLDILLYGDTIVDEPELKIPHPCMCQRWFVLKPLTDLCPERIIPGPHISVETALRRLEGNNSEYENS